MKFPFLNHPETGKPDLMVTLTTVVTIAAVIKFILDGVSMVINGHTISFGHVDSMTYGSVLAPVLGAHSFIHSNDKKGDPNGNESKN